MLWNQMSQETVVIGWDFYGPVILFVILLVVSLVQLWLMRKHK